MILFSNGATRVVFAFAVGGGGGAVLILITICERAAIVTPNRDDIGHREGEGRNTHAVTGNRTWVQLRASHAHKPLHRMVGAMIKTYLHNILQLNI